MEAAVAIFIGLVIVFVVVVVAGLSPFLALPILALVLAIPVLYGRMAARMSKGPVDDAPSSTESSYDPVVDPSER
jgi:H+/gluconate symporter-like permease